MSSAKTVKTFSIKMIDVLTARVAEVHSKDTETAIEYFSKNSKAIDATFDRPEFKELQRALLKNARIADKAHDKENYIAVKVVVKIAKCASAITTGILSEIDAHTRIIGHQLAKLQSLTAKSAQVAQSKGIVYSEFDTAQELDYKHTANYSVGTTGTQTSSTRMMFKYLGICDVTKNKRDDMIVVSDNERSRAFIGLFA